MKSISTQKSIMKSIVNKKSYTLNRTVLKYIAIVCMLVDHIGMRFLPSLSALGIACRVLGRITCPVMCLFIAEGFYHTSSKSKYILRLLAFAFASQAAYTFFKYGTVYTYELFTDYNVIFTLAASFVALLVYERIKIYALKWLAVIGIAAATYFCDWGVFAPALVIAFHVLRNSKNRQALAFVIISALLTLSSILFYIINNELWYSELWQLGLFLFIPLLYLYDGRQGSNNAFNKWFFYAFYPIHLALLGLIALSVL